MRGNQTRGYLNAPKIRAITLPSKRDRNRNKQYIDRSLSRDCNAISALNGLSAFGTSGMCRPQCFMPACVRRDPSGRNPRQLFAQRWSANCGSALVRDNTDLFPCRALTGQRFSCCELHSAAIGELDITPDEWSAALKDILRANRKAHRRASGAVHC